MTSRVALGVQLASQATRPRALETLLIAHVALDTTFLAARRAPEVSPACRCVLALLAADPAAACTLAAAVAIDAWPLPDDERRAATLLARDAMALTAADLVVLPRDALLAWLSTTDAGLRRRRTPVADRTLEAYSPGGAAA